MAISGQGLASGFSGGFKMMDDYYNRQETQQLNRETAERTKTVYEQGQKKIRIEDAIKGAAMDIKAGRMPSQQWVDTLQNDLGYDLYQNLDPQYQQSVDNILNQKNPIASPEFVADANIAFKDYLNKNNTQTDFTTFGREIETGMGDSFQSEAAQKLEVGSYRGKPQTIKGKRILNKELVGSMYAMGGETIGGDVEVTYEDMDGNIKTYIAPMTDGQGTSGDGDNVVGQDVGKLLQNLKGRTMLSDGLSPLMKSLSSLMVSQGINIPINDVDKERLRSYETQATNYMTLARQNAKDMFPKASESDQMMIMMAASKNQDLSELQLADGSKPNAEAVAAYKANMAKAQGLFNKIDVIHKKYSLGDFQNSSVEAGIQSKIAEPFVPMNEKVSQFAQANNGVQTNANPNGQGIQPPKPDGTSVGGTSVAPQRAGLNAAVSTVASGKGINPAATRREDGLGIDPNRYPSGKVELPFLNQETVKGMVKGSANDTRRTVRDMNEIIDISESGNLGAWLGESFENQKQAQNILDTAVKDEYLSKENTADVTAFAQLLSDNQIPMDNPKSINYAGYVQGLQSDRQKKVDGAINYTKEAVNEAVIDRELVDMKAALNDPDMMALIRKEVSRDPNAHIDEVENLLSSIQALPKTNKTYEQYEAVYKYWSEIGGAQRMSPAAAPAGDGLFDSWVQGVKSMMGKAPPSVYDQMEGSGLMDQINIVIQLGELGKLNQYVKEKGDEAIKQIYSAALSRKAPAAVLERLIPDAPESTVSEYSC